MEGAAIVNENVSGLQIRAFNFKRIEGGNLKAFCSVDIGGKIKLHSCRIIQHPEQQAWPSLAQTEWPDPEGQKRYFPIIELPEHVRHAVMKAILQGWQEFEHASA